MKRSVLLISAFAVFGLLFTQCKKNQEVLPVIPSGEKIDVTLNIPNNGGGKTSIADDGTIVWSRNDKIVVCYTEGDTKGVAGILSLLSGSGSSNATFTGQITLMGNQTAGNFASYSYDFHYLGSNFDETTITEGNSYKTSYTLDFTNQDGTLEGLSKLHYAKGTGNFKNVNGTWTANLVLMNKICVFSYDVTDMVDQTNTYAVDNFYMTFPGSAVPNTKLTISFVGGNYNYNVDNTTKSIYVGKPTKQLDGNTYKLYVILPGYGDDVPNSLPKDVDVRFFSDSHSQKVVISHPAEHFAHNCYNGGLNEEGGYNFDGDIGECNDMLTRSCARGIFKTASGRLIRFAKGNLKYNLDVYIPEMPGAQIHNSQVAACLENNTPGKNSYDHFAFGATGLSLLSGDYAPKPTELYQQDSPEIWYSLGYTLTSNYDYGNMLTNSIFSTMRSDDLTNLHMTRASYINNNSSAKVPPQGRSVLILTKETITNLETNLTPELITQYENQYNAIFLLFTGYNTAPDPENNKTTSWQDEGKYNYYWLADGNENNQTIKMLNLSTFICVDVPGDDVRKEGYPVRLVHTEFDPNSSN